MTAWEPSSDAEWWGAVRSAAAGQEAPNGLLREVAGLILTPEWLTPLPRRPRREYALSLMRAAPDADPFKAELTQVMARWGHWRAGGGEYAAGGGVLLREPRPGRIGRWPATELLWSPGKLPVPSNLRVRLPRGYLIWEEVLDQTRLALIAAHALIRDQPNARAFLQCWNFHDMDLRGFRPSYGDHEWWARTSALNDLREMALGWFGGYCDPPLFPEMTHLKLSVDRTVRQALARELMRELTW